MRACAWPRRRCPSPTPCPTTVLRAAERQRRDQHRRRHRQRWLQPAGRRATNSSGLDTSSAGAKAGTATIQFVSDGAGTSNLGQTALASQNVAVTGNVYRLASLVLNTPSVTVVGRVGDPVSTQAVSITNASPDLFTEGPGKTVAGSAATPRTNGAGITNLAAAGQRQQHPRGLANTTTAGTSNGSVTLSFGVDGRRHHRCGRRGTGHGQRQRDGKPYTAAVGQLNTSSVDFGIVRVGQVVGRRCQRTNAATTTALNDNLVRHAGWPERSAATPRSAASSPARKAAWRSRCPPPRPVLYQQAGTVSLCQPRRRTGRRVGRAHQQVTVTAQVNNLPDARVRKVGGAGTLSAKRRHLRWTWAR